MDEQLDKELADFFALRLIHVCDEQVITMLAEAIRLRVVQLEEAIAEVAAHQHGVITWLQLTGLGLKRGAIESWVRTKRLHRIYRGVYLVGNPSPAPFAVEMGAVLACGRRSFLSHETSLAVDSVVPASAEPHVTVVGRRVAIEGIRPHHLPTLHPADTRFAQGIPMVSTARALVEIAGTHDPEPWPTPSKRPR